jgi:DNA ligase-associated metallophosphoesterase
LEVVFKKGHLINWKEQKILMLPEKLIFLPQTQSLLIADPHFGKAAHFRKSGVPIPENVHTGDYLQLQRILDELKPKEVFFLGDLFHSDWNTAWNDLEVFLEFFPKTIFHLIKGNHDILSALIYRSELWNVHESSYQLGKLLLTHEPQELIPENTLNICGHIHPGVSLRGKGRQSLSLPCFFLSGNILIMPAFGRFTGLAKMKGKEGDVAYVTVDKKVIPVDFRK